MSRISQKNHTLKVKLLLLYLFLYNFSPLLLSFSFLTTLHSYLTATCCLPSANIIIDNFCSVRGLVRGDRKREREREKYLSHHSNWIKADSSNESESSDC